MGMFIEGMSRWWKEMKLPKKIFMVAFAAIVIFGFLRSFSG